MGSLTSQASKTSVLWAQLETLSQKIRWNMILKDTQCQPLANTHMHIHVHTYTCARIHKCTHTCACTHTQRYIYIQHTHKEKCIVAHTSKTWEAGELLKVPGQLKLQNESLSHKNTTTNTGEVTRKGKANDAEVYSMSLNSRTTEEGENQLLESCPLLSTHTP